MQSMSQLTTNQSSASFSKDDNMKLQLHLFKIARYCIIYWGHTREITEDHMVKCHINSYDNCNLRPLGY